MATDLTQNTRLLKSIVIGLGVAIVVMFVVVVVTIIVRPSGFAARSGPVSASLSLGPGERLQDLTGAGPLVVLRLAGPDGERLLTIDPVSGRVIANLTLAAPVDGPPPE